MGALQGVLASPRDFYREVSKMGKVCGGLVLGFAKFFYREGGKTGRWVLYCCWEKCLWGGALGAHEGHKGKEEHNVVVAACGAKHFYSSPCRNINTANQLLAINQVILALPFSKKMSMGTSAVSVPMQSELGKCQACPSPSVPARADVQAGIFS